MLKQNWRQQSAILGAECKGIPVNQVFKDSESERSNIIKTFWSN